MGTAGIPGIGLPEAGGIRGEDFIGEDDALSGSAELEFGVGEDEAAGLGVLGGALVEAEGEPAEFGGVCGAERGIRLRQRRCFRRARRPGFWWQG